MNKQALLTFQFIVNLINLSGLCFVLQRIMCCVQMTGNMKQEGHLAAVCWLRLL